MLLQKIKSEEFYTMNDHDVVGLSLLGVLELVLLGHEVRYTVADWCFREPDSGPPKYSLMGFTWAFKKYRVGALNFYTRKERHPRALAWRFKRRFLRKYIPHFLFNVFVIVKGARPKPRLTPDVVEAQADWWLASKAFFDGDIREPPPIPPPVNQHSRDDFPEYIYRHMVEQDNFLKAQDEKRKSHDILIKQMYDDWQAMRGERIPATMKGPIYVGEHCDLRLPTGHYNDLLRGLLPIRLHLIPHPKDGPSHTRDVGGVILDVMNRERRDCRLGIFLRSPYTHLPPTTVVPQKQAEKSKKNIITANISAFDLGKAVGDDNARDDDDDVRITGARTTGDFISYENVDPSKVKRLKEAWIRGRAPAKRGWLSNDQINAWIELLIRSRPDGARWTITKSGTASLNLGSEIFLLETDRVLMGMLDGSTRPTLHGML
ncbi:hypothetical protein Tco_1377576 [Tanacetum coccineum]